MLLKNLHKKRHILSTVLLLLIFLVAPTIRLVQGTGEIIGIENSILWSFNAHGCVKNTPAVGDLLGDEHLETVIASTYNQTIYCVDYQGNELWHALAGGICYADPIIVDINNDGTNEVLVAVGDGSLLCLDNNGAILWNSTFPGACFRSMAVADINNDNTLEIVVEENYKVICFDNLGSELWNYTLLSGNTAGAPLLVDIDNTPTTLEVIFNTDSYVRCLNTTGHLQWQYLTGKRLSNSPQAGDLNGDGSKEIIVAGQDTLFCLNATGDQQWNYIIPSTSWGFSHGDALIGSLTNGSKEIIIGDIDGYVYCLDSTGSLHWRVEVSYGEIYTQPQLYDFNDDGTMEIVLNNAQAHFLFANGTEIASYSGIPHYSDPILHDFDMSGKIDLLLSYRLDELTVILKTEPTPTPTPTPTTSTTTSGTVGISIIAITGLISLGMMLLIVHRKVEIN